MLYNVILPCPPANRKGNRKRKQFSPARRPDIPSRRETAPEGAGSCALEDGVLNLDCGDQVMPFLYLDKCICFMVYEKDHAQ